MEARRRARVEEARRRAEEEARHAEEERRRAEEERRRRIAAEAEARRRRAEEERRRRIEERRQRKESGMAERLRLRAAATSAPSPVLATRTPCFSPMQPAASSARPARAADARLGLPLAAAPPGAGDLLAASVASVARSVASEAELVSRWISRAGGDDTDSEGSQAPPDDEDDAATGAAGAPDVVFGGTGALTGPDLTAPPPTAAERGSGPGRLSAGAHWIAESASVVLPIGLTGQTGALAAGTTVLVTDCGVVVDRGTASETLAVLARLGLAAAPPAETAAAGAGGTHRAGGISVVDPSSAASSSLPSVDILVSSALPAVTASAAWVPSSAGCSFSPCLLRGGRGADGRPAVAAYSFRGRSWLRVKADEDGAEALGRSGATFSSLTADFGRQADGERRVLVLGGVREGSFCGPEAVTVGLDDDRSCESDVALTSASHALGARAAAPAAGAEPLGRAFHGACVSAEGRVAFFGGVVPRPGSSSLAGATPSDQLWELDCRTKRWSNLGARARGEGPGARALPSLSALGDALLVAGGCAPAGSARAPAPLHDVFVLSTSTCAWARVAVTSHPSIGPAFRLGACSGGSMTVGDTPMLVLGGQAHSGSSRHESQLLLVSLPEHPLQDLCLQLARARI